MFVRQRRRPASDRVRRPRGRSRDDADGGTPVRVATDGGYDRIPLSEWDRLASALADLDRADVTVGDDRIELRSGSARLAVTREGGIEASMPLHDFRREGVDALYVDRETGRVQVRTDGLEYEFRNP